MKTLNVKLADNLETHGWDLVESRTEDLDWWADELWELKSRWSPEGAVAFVTFLVDPMTGRTRRKGEGVWAVGCSPTFPRTKEQAVAGDTLSLKASKDEVEEFLQVIDSFRQSHGNV